MTIAYHPAVIAVFTTLLISSAVHAGDWPQWRGPTRDGISAEKHWQSRWAPEGPRKLWSQKVGAGYSSMAVSNGRIYTLGNTDNVDAVWCFDAGTGVQVWKHEYPCSAKDPNGYKGTRCTPTVDGDRVYTVSRKGHLFCLDAATGKVRWSKNLLSDFQGREPMHSGDREGWGFSGSPLIEKDMLLIEAGGNGSSVIALNKQTGDLIWKNGKDVAGYASLVAFDLEGERCFTQFSADQLILRRMKDGAELWRMPWKTSYGVNAATPIVHDNKIFISTGYGYGCALIEMTPKAGKELWRNKNMRNHVNSCVLVDGHLYGFDDSELKCLDWNTGAVKWGTRGYGKGSLMSADGKLILWGQSGKLGIAEASPAGFKEISSYQALDGRDTWANPVLANGRIYVRNLDTLLALDVSRQ